MSGFSHSMCDSHRKHSWHLNFERSCGAVFVLPWSLFSLCLPSFSLYPSLFFNVSLFVSSLYSVGRQPEVQPGYKVAVLQLGGGHLHSLPCPQVPMQRKLWTPQQVFFNFSFCLTFGVLNYCQIQSKLLPSTQFVNRYHTHSQESEQAGWG